MLCSCTDACSSIGASGNRDRGVVLSGVLRDPYTGKTLPYDRSRASEIEIGLAAAVKLTPAVYR